MDNKGRILIVDDDKSILKSLTILLESYFEVVDSISNPNLILSTYQNKPYDVVLLDMNFSAGINSGNEGLYWLNKLLTTDKSAIVIMITAYGDIDLAVKALKQGAFDFVAKPWNNEKLVATLKSALKIKQSQAQINKLCVEKKSLSQELNKSDKIIGTSEAMNKIFTIIDKVAKTDANILILGENGTGKELVAKEIHRKSNRKNHPLISVDLGSIPESLFESELFGHSQGAFTDAKENRIGRFEIANKGTLFLDEIGNIPASLQSKLLTCIQNKEIVPIGKNSSVKIDTRLICATNKNPEEQIEKGLFREDLFYRINTIQIELPPLRKRGDDILLIAEHYLKIFSIKYEKPLLKFSKEALNILLKYNWPGNIRELKHTIEKAVILCSEDILQPADFMLKTVSSLKNKNEWPLKFEEIEKKAIERALENNNGKIVVAAKELGLTRQTLHNKIKKYKL
ncbi:MAG: sigma-54 dependent transcriptional regulator [Bacteroidales bacterium]|nr:sigma-54 dependent transcriptional regulator [Bacteroidales bacterium]